MSLEIGKNNQGHPLKARVVTSYSGSIKPPPEFTKENNTKDVYDGPDHIWPPRDDHTVILRDVTSFQVRYIWGSDSGRDLDTSSFYINTPISSINRKTVGWSQDASNIIPYLYWGGDNTASGAECVMFNVEAFQEQGYWDRMPAILKLALGVRWYGERYDGSFKIEVTAYKNGTIVRAYQILNKDDTASDGAYIYPLADGTIKVKNTATGNIENCWYGQAVQIGNNFYKINQVDDSIIGLPEGLDIRVERVSPLSSHKYERGWLVPINGNGVSYKIWNNQYNRNGNIVSLSSPRLVGTNAAQGNLVHVLLNSSGTRDGVTRYALNSHSFQFGFVAGNSEFKGQYLLNLNAPEGSEIENPYLAARISYTTDTLMVTIEGEDPIRYYISNA